MSDLGKILITMGGDYNPSIEYERLTCVRYNRASWVSKDTTIGNEPVPGSPYWEQITEDGYTQTVVRYNVKVPAEDWNFDDEAKYPEYPFYTNLLIDGITAASSVHITFDYDEMMSNNFSPLCNSFYGGVTIYSKHLIEEDFIIPVITASKFYDTDELLDESVKNQINTDIADTNHQLLETKQNVADVQESLKILTNIALDDCKEQWHIRSSDNIDLGDQINNKTYKYALDIPVDGIDENWVAQVVFLTDDSMSKQYAPVTKTWSEYDPNLKKNLGYVRIYSSYQAETLHIPTIILQKVSTCTLDVTEAEVETTAADV